MSTGAGTLSTNVTIAYDSADERKSKAGHLVAVANQENIADEDCMVPGLARERRNPERKAPLPTLSR